MATTFNPDCDTSRRWNHINLAFFVLLILLFDPELQDIPSSRMSSGTVEMGTELGR
jgi:hypothetical protein